MISSQEQDNLSEQREVLAFLLADSTGEIHSLAELVAELGQLQFSRLVINEFRDDTRRKLCVPSWIHDDLVTLDI